MDLLGVLKLPPETLIHSFGGLLRATYHGLYIDLKATVQKLVYFPIIIVIIPDAEHAVDVVPDGPAQHAGVHIFVCGHGVVCQVVGDLKLLIQHLTNIRVEPVYQRVAVVLPAVVLDSEGGHLFPSSGEVFVAVAGVLKVTGDISRWNALLVLSCDHQHALGLLPLKTCSHLLLARFFIVTALLQLLHSLHQDLHLPIQLLHEDKSEVRKENNTSHRNGLKA